MSTTNIFDLIILGGKDVTDDKLIRSFLEHFDRDEDDALNLKEFEMLIRELFTDASGRSHSVPMPMVEEMFDTFDLNRDDKVDFEEFQRLWMNWIVPIIHPNAALIIIDVQNDFIDGSVAIRDSPAGQEAEEVVPAINHLLSSVSFKTVVYTYDWHPNNHISFIDNIHLRKLDQASIVSAENAKAFDIVVFEGPPKIEQKLWPRHCVQNSWGAELHNNLHVVDEAIFIYKGTCPEIDSYSAFWDNEKRSQTNLVDVLKERAVTDVFVCGLAYEYCVGYTALHALEHGYRTVLIDDACRGVANDGIGDMRQKLTAQHGIVVTSDMVKNMVEGKDRRPELGYRTAMITSAINEEDSLTAS